MEIKLFVSVTQPYSNLLGTVKYEYYFVQNAIVGSNFISVTPVHFSASRCLEIFLLSNYLQSDS